MAADVRRDVRHLHPVNLVVLADHAVEAVFPVQRDQRHTVLVEVEKAAVSVHELLFLRFAPVLNDRLKAAAETVSDSEL